MTAPDGAERAISAQGSDPWAVLRGATRARVALGRAGDGLPTARELEFRAAPAVARDARRPGRRAHRTGRRPGSDVARRCRGRPGRAGGGQPGAGPVDLPAAPRPR